MCNSFQFLCLLLGFDVADCAFFVSAGRSLTRLLVAGRDCEGVLDRSDLRPAVRNPTQPAGGRRCQKTHDAPTSPAIPFRSLRSYATHRRSWVSHQEEAAEAAAAEMEAESRGGGLGESERVLIHYVQDLARSDLVADLMVAGGHFSQVLPASTLQVYTC